MSKTDTLLIALAAAQRDNRGLIRRIRKLTRSLAKKENEATNWHGKYVATFHALAAVERERDLAKTDEADAQDVLIQVEDERDELKRRLEDLIATPPTEVERIRQIMLGTYEPTRMLLEIRRVLGMA